MKQDKKLYNSPFIEDRESVMFLIRNNLSFMKKDYTEFELVQIKRKSQDEKINNKIDNHIRLYELIK